MTDEPPRTPEPGPFPRQAREGRPVPSRRAKVLKVALVATGVVVGGGLVVVAVVGLVYGLNPMGDEWVCSDGEAPAGANGHYNACYSEDSTLPPGVSWDPFGNRPMPYNCDKDGWMLIERTVIRRGVADDERDCVREGTDLPEGWHVVRDD